MSLFGRKKKEQWPAHLERRRPQNAAMRKERDEEHKKRVTLQADLAAQQTQANDMRLAQVDAAVKSITARMRRG